MPRLARFLFMAVVLATACNGNPNGSSDVADPGTQQVPLIRTIDLGSLSRAGVLSPYPVSTVNGLCFRPLNDRGEIKAKLEVTGAVEGEIELQSYLVSYKDSRTYCNPNAWQCQGAFAVRMDHSTAVDAQWRFDPPDLPGEYCLLVRNLGWTPITFRTLGQITLYY